MRPLGTGELARMERISSSQMMDRCKVMTRAAGAKDAYNRPVETFTIGTEIACTLLTQQPDEFQGTGQQTPKADVRLRVPLGTAISHLDQVQVTKRFGRVLSAPLTYRISGEPIPMVDALEMEVELV